MIRFAMWFVVWCLMLGAGEIEVEYSDGLRIHLKALWGPRRER